MITLEPPLKRQRIRHRKEVTDERAAKVVLVGTRSSSLVTIHGRCALSGASSVDNNNQSHRAQRFVAQFAGIHLEVVLELAESARFQQPLYFTFSHLQYVSTTAKMNMNSPHLVLDQLLVGSASVREVLPGISGNEIIVFCQRSCLESVLEAGCMLVNRATAVHLRLHCPAEADGLHDVVAPILPKRFPQEWSRYNYADVFHFCRLLDSMRGLGARRMQDAIVSATVIYQGCAAGANVKSRLESGSLRIPDRTTTQRWIVEIDIINMGYRRTLLQEWPRQSRTVQADSSRAGGFDDWHRENVSCGGRSVSVTSRRRTVHLHSRVAIAICL